MAKRLNNKNKKQIYAIVLGFLCVTLFCMLTNFLGFYKHFIIGAFGLVMYPIIILLICWCSLKLANKTFSLDGKSFAFCIGIFLAILAIFQMIFTRTYDFSSYGNYLSEVYSTNLSPGGVIIGLFVFPVRYLLHEVATYIVFSIILVVLIAFAIDNYFYKMNKIMRSKQNRNYADSKKAIIDVQKAMQEDKKENVRANKAEELENLEDEQSRKEAEEQSQKVKEILGLTPNREETSKNDAYDILYGDSSAKRNAMNTLFPEKQSTYSSSMSDGYLQDNLQKYMSEDRKKSAKLVSDSYEATSSSTRKVKEEEQASIEYLNRTIPKSTQKGTLIRGDYYNDADNAVEIVGGEENEEDSYSTLDNSFDSFNDNSFNFNTFDEEENEEEKELQDVLHQTHSYGIEDDIKENDEDSSIITQRFMPSHNVFDGDDTNSFVDEDKEDEDNSGENFFASIKDIHQDVKEEKPAPKPIEVKIEPPKVEKKKPKKYFKPPITFLKVESTDLSGIKADTVEKTQILEKTLASFKIPAKVNDVIVGPSITMYEMTMPIGISVKSIYRYQDDIAMALASKEGIRIQAPIPGKNAVGIEVPNEKPATVGFREAFEKGEFDKQASKPLSFVLGKDIFGNYQFCDIAKAPHMLIAGSTGSGKSVCLNIMLLSLLYKNSPEDVKLILIDPKKVEFAIYEGIPHLMLPSVITEPDKAASALNWAVNEMERRYRVFQQVKLRDISEYNSSPEVKSGERDKMPYIVIVVDELADLMAVVKRDVEDKIQRLAAKARSAGIHLVLATQRPSIDVVTGTIKNNLPVRIAFRVSSFTDSKTVIDAAGAEKLLGRGDMLYCASGSSPKRIQSPFVDTPEVKNIVEFIKENNEADYDENIENIMFESQENQKEQATKPVVAPRNVAETDEMFVHALKLVVETRQASASMLQRRLRLGWNRAGSLIDAMEKMHYISEPISNKRQVLISMEQFTDIYGEVEDLE